MITWTAGYTATPATFRVGSLTKDIARLERQKLAEMKEACWFERDVSGKPLRGYLKRRPVPPRTAAPLLSPDKPP
jgi:hypothetical protein